MRSGLVFGVGLAVVFAVPAFGQGLPSVPTPSLPAVPNLPAPPAVPLPQPPAVPAVPSLPDVPDVPALPSVPAVPGSGGLQGASSESVTSTGGSGGGSSGGGATSAGGRAAGGSDRGGAGATAPGPRTAGGSGTAAGRRGGSAPARTTRRSADRRVEARRDQRLRKKVLRLTGCIGALPQRERRVLTLRAGLGDDRPQTRRRVARTLHLSGERVRRLERSGVRRLRRLVLAGRCSAAENEGAIGGATAADRAAALGGLAASGFGVGALGLIAARTLTGSSGTTSDRVEVKSERKSSEGGAREPALAPDARRLPPGLAAIVDDGSADLTLPLLGLVALVGIFAAGRAVRRTRGSDGGPAV